MPILIFSPLLQHFLARCCAVALMIKLLSYAKLYGNMQYLCCIIIRLGLADIPFFAYFCLHIQVYAIAGVDMAICHAVWFL